MATKAKSLPAPRASKKQEWTRIKNFHLFQVGGIMGNLHNIRNHAVHPSIIAEVEEILNSMLRLQDKIREAKYVD